MDGEALRQELGAPSSSERVRHQFVDLAEDREVDPSGVAATAVKPSSL